MVSKNEVKYIQSLKLRRQRLAERRFVAEGPKLLEELLKANTFNIDRIYATGEWLLQQPAANAGLPLVEVSTHELERISFLQSPQQVLALVEIPDTPFVPIDQSQWSLALDGIQDPGNMGTLVRIADWFGIQDLYCSADTADIYNPKVVQATMGSLFRTRVHYGPLEQWVALAKVPVYGALLDGENLWHLPALPPGIVVIGSEGKGLSEGLTKLVTQRVTIPRLGGAESLNAAVAAGIVLSHLMKAG